MIALSAAELQKFSQLRLPNVPPGDWNLLFSDDFTSLSLRSGGPTAAGYVAGSGVWTPRYSWSEVAQGDTHATENGFNTDPAYAWGGGYPANGQFLQSGSILTIQAQTIPSSLSGKIPTSSRTGLPYPWVTGILQTKNSFTFKAPIFAEARMKIPKGISLWPAFWMYAVTGGLTTEIDVIEQLNTQTNQYIATLHWGPDASPVQIDGGWLSRPLDLSLAYHNYGVLWQGGQFIFFCDRQPVWTYSQPAAWDDTYMYLLLDLAVGSTAAWTGLDPDGTTPNPAQLLIDWVKVWGTGATPWASPPSYVPTYELLGF